MALVLLEQNLTLCTKHIYADRVAKADQPVVPQSIANVKCTDPLSWRLEIVNAASGHSSNKKKSPDANSTLRLVQIPPVPPFVSSVCDPLITPEEALPPIPPSNSPQYDSETKRCLPSPDEIEVQVRATGVNFRDALKATGKYPAEFDETLDLDAECSGIVTKVGSNVKSIKPGDRAAVCASSCFASYVIAKESFTSLLPDDISFEDAAGIFGPYLTAYYGLVTEARIRKGETILIHGASGWCGYASNTYLSACRIRNLLYCRIRF